MTLTPLVRVKDNHALYISSPWWYNIVHLGINLNNFSLISTKRLHSNVNITITCIHILLFRRYYYYFEHNLIFWYYNFLFNQCGTLIANPTCWKIKIITIKYNYSRQTFRLVSHWSLSFEKYLIDSWTKMFLISLKVYNFVPNGSFSTVF